MKSYLILVKNLFLKPRYAKFFEKIYHFELFRIFRTFLTISICRFAEKETNEKVIFLFMKKKITRYFNKFCSGSQASTLHLRYSKHLSRMIC